jgi:hypothetical protein
VIAQNTPNGDDAWREAALVSWIGSGNAFVDVMLTPRVRAARHQNELDLRIW